MPELMDIGAIATSGHYQKHAEFWKNTIGRIEGEFRLAQNWQSYALPMGPPPDHTFAVDGAAGQFLRDTAHANALSTFVILLAALFRVLEKYSGSHDCFVRTPRLATERGPEPTEEFAGSIPLIAISSAGLTVREYLNRVREMVQGSYTYQEFPVDDFARMLPRKKPATNVEIHFEGLHEPASTHCAPDSDLWIVIRGSDRIAIALHANPKIFTLHFLEHFARHWRNVVAEFGALDSPIEAVSLLDQAEKLRLLSQADAVRVDGTALEGFAERAQASPGSIAIVTEEGELTYGELDDQSSRLAHFLTSEYSLGRGDAVGILSDRSERWVIGLLAVLKAGGVYLPLDPEYPQERLRFMIDDANVRALLVHSEHLPLLTDFWTIPMVALDFQLAALDPSPPRQPFAVGSDDPAYIIYTSGSTGVPKGVVLRHRGLLNMARHHVEAFGFDSTDCLMQFYSASFDGSLMEVFVALLAGARLVLARTEVVKDPRMLSAYMARQGVTTVNALPVYLSALDWPALDCVRRVISAGDNARVEDARRLAKTKTFHNSYGPTEATVCVADYVVDPEVAYGACLPVGKPIRNVHLYLLDEQGELAPEGCTGEVCIAGVALAHGYLHRDDLTAEGFVAHPFDPGERLYRTGDLGVWLPDGNLEISGRRDAQVKIRGYRIELGEIEAALLKQKAVTDAVVLVHEDSTRGRYLVAWVAPAKAAAADLREALKTRLPEFMVPSAFFTMDKLPLLPNGKIDRKALQLMTPASAAAPASYRAPENEIEKQLAFIWAQLLGREQVDIYQDFFQLGGDSILILQVVSRAHQAGIKLTAKQHFDHPTIAALAKVAGTVSRTGVSQELVSGPAKLTAAQHWFFSQRVADPHHYNQSVMIEVPADLEARVIEQAFHALVEHHDALRLAFFEVGGAWEQIGAPRCPAISVRVTAPADEDALLAEATRLQESFDLSRPPLVRAHLFQFGSGQPARLLIVVHHLVVDGVSWRILLEDLHAACSQIQAGEPVRLPAKTTALRDWTQRLTEFGATNFDGLDDWRRAAGAVDPLFDGASRGMVASAASIGIEFEEEQTRLLLQQAPRALNAEIDEILLAALLLSFRSWTGSPALRVDLEGHGREDILDDIDLSRTVGWFTAIYPVLLVADGAGTPVEVLQAVKERVRAVPMRGLSHGIARYLREDAASRGDETSPVLFNYLGQIDRVLPEGAGWKPILGSTGPEHSPRALRAHLFEIEAIVFAGRFRLTCTYNRDAYSPGAIDGLMQTYKRSLLTLIESPGSQAQGPTPSDLPAAGIEGDALNTLVARMHS